MTDRAYDLKYPQPATHPVIFNSPHSGRVYPPDLIEKTLLSQQALRSSEDAFVDELFADVVDFGAYFLCAQIARAYVDVNRAADELDPSIIEGVTQAKNNPRIASGLGVIPRVVAESRHIQSGRLTRAEAENRLQKWYHPYHAALGELISTVKNQFGMVLVLDCHSMPSDVVRTPGVHYKTRPDIILGNRFGTSVRDDIFDCIRVAFEKQGFQVVQNVPFSGGYITKAYGIPARNQHVVQVEINRGLYMDEKRIVKTYHFKDLKHRLVRVSQDICENLRPSFPMAAE